MPNEHLSEYLSSPLLLASRQTLRLAHLIHDHMPNEHLSRYFFHIFCSLRSKACDSLTSSTITCQINNHQDACFPHFCSLRSKHCDSLTSSMITCQMNNHQDACFPHFCSLQSKACDSLTSSMIKCQMNIYQDTFFTCFAHVEAKVRAQSPQPSSHAQGTFIFILFSPLLLTSKQSLRLTHLSHRHMPNEHLSRYFFHIFC